MNPGDRVIGQGRVYSWLPKVFRGTIKKVEFNLSPDKVAAEEQDGLYLERFADAVRN